MIENVLFYEGHVSYYSLDKRVAVRRRMDIVLVHCCGEMIPGDERDLNFLTFVL